MSFFILSFLFAMVMRYSNSWASTGMYIDKLINRLVGELQYFCIDSGMIEILYYVSHFS